MTRTILALPTAVYDALRRHLLPAQDGPEEAAFVFVRRHAVNSTEVFQHIDWFPIPPEGFASRSPFHFELTDATRAAVIKRAHDLGASLVEFHSHAGPWLAQFSPSDWAGFEEFVPHVWWRLKRRPYLAIIVTPTGFDGLVWLTGADVPARLDGILVDGRLLEPTRLSPLEREAYDE